MSSDLAIGIDLGTTNSCVGVFRNGCVKIIPNDQGSNITPSYVKFNKNGGRLIGSEAKNKTTFEPESTIFNSKRLLGRKFDDPILQEMIKTLPFRVVKEGAIPKIEIIIGEIRRTYCPEEISSMILEKMKDAAVKYLKQDVSSCVITVPAYFNDSQRQATIDAGKIARLDVLRIINEPTAAAIAYGFTKNNKEKQNVLIYDLGGGTFDVSILRIQGTNIKVLSTDGNTNLGGENFNEQIFQHVSSEFEKKHSKSFVGNNRAVSRVRLACERGKISLSTATQTNIDVDNVIGDLDLGFVLTRKKFEEINEDLFNSTMSVVSNCLKYADLDKSEIDEIVLVGGSSRIPKIRSIVQQFFNGKDLNKCINPDEAVAYGASIYAAMIKENKSKEISDVNFKDVTPMSLGIDVYGDKTDIIISKNSTIPQEVTKSYTTSKDNQTSLSITVLEGECEMTKDNNILGEFIIEGFPSRKQGEINFNVTFKIDDNGILTVDCEETSSLINKKIKIINDKGRLSANEIQRLMDENKIARNEQDVLKQIINQKNKIYDYCFDMNNIVSNDVSERAKIEILEKCNEIIEWVDENQNENLETYLLKYENVKSYCDNHLNS